MWSAPPFDEARPNASDTASLCSSGKQLAARIEASSKKNVQIAADMPNA
jgi:hypothetical protein